MTYYPYDPNIAPNNPYNAGYLLPRLTTAQRDAIDTTAYTSGWIVFNTDTQAAEVLTQDGWVPATLGDNTTGSGDLVLQNSPTLTAPTLGNATATNANILAGLEIGSPAGGLPGTGSINMSGDLLSNATVVVDESRNITSANLTVNGTLTLDAPSNTGNQGINFTQADDTPYTVPEMAFKYNEWTITDNKAVQAGYGTIGWYLNMNIGSAEGSNENGQINGLYVGVSHNYETSTNSDSVAVVGANYYYGGDTSVPFAGPYGGNFAGHVESGASTGMVVGLEAAANIAVGGSALTRAGIIIDVNDTYTEQASGIDSAILVSSIANGGGFNTLITLSDIRGYPALQIGGTIIAAADPEQIKYAFDFTNLTITADILKHANAVLTGTGSLFLASTTQTTALEVGSAAGGMPGTGSINISGDYFVAGSQIAASNLANGTTGTGEIVLATSATLISPNIGSASAASINIVNGIELGSPTGGMPGTGSINMSGNLYSNDTIVVDTSRNISSTNLIASGTVTFSGVPTSNPHVVGQLWNNSGVLTVSAG